MIFLLKSKFIPTAKIRIEPINDIFEMRASLNSGAIILAKLSVVPVRRGYWGNKIGKPHTVPCKVNIESIDVFYNIFLL